MAALATLRRSFAASLCGSVRFLLRKGLVPMRYGHRVQSVTVQHRTSPSEPPQQSTHLLLIIVDSLSGICPASSKSVRATSLGSLPDFLSDKLSSKILSDCVLLINDCSFRYWARQKPRNDLTGGVIGRVILGYVQLREADSFLKPLRDALEAIWCADVGLQMTLVRGLKSP
jgi:hypothetical protein